MKEDDLASWYLGELDRIEADERGKRRWSADYWGKGCPVCGKPVEGADISGRRLHPCDCAPTREQFNELVGMVSAPDKAVLADLMTKRRIVRIGATSAVDEGEAYNVWANALRLLASVHADRPGYRKAWRP